MTGLMKDYYKILGVDEDASQEEIRARWIELTKHHHPDRREEMASDERIKEINAAYQVLKHSSTRVEYDLKRAYGQKKRAFRMRRLAISISVVIVLIILGAIYFKNSQTFPGSKLAISNEIDAATKRPKDAIDSMSSKNGKNHAPATVQKPFVASTPQRIDASTQGLKDPMNGMPQRYDDSINVMNSATQRPKEAIALTDATIPTNITISTSQTTPLAQLPNGSITNRLGKPTDQKDARDTTTQRLKDPINPTDSIDSNPQPLNNTPALKLQFAQSKPLSLLSTEEEIKQFFAAYIDRYTQKDIEGFLSCFSSKAIQNQKDGLPEIRKIYSDFFNQSRELHYLLEDPKIEIYQNAVEVKARYVIDQIPKEGSQKRIWRGSVRWVLTKEEEKLKIISIDYRYTMPPTPLLERGPKPKGEPAGKPVAKPEIPEKVEEKVPQPPLAKEEEVRQFFSSYIDQYHRKDIDGFLSFFSSKAVQNQKDGLKGIKNIYTKFFDESQELRYHLEGMKIGIYENAVEVRARFRVDQILKRRGEKKVWTGIIHWVLVKEDGALKIISLDYQNEKTPSKEGAEKTS